MLSSYCNTITLSGNIIMLNRNNVVVMGFRWNLPVLVSEMR